jgi:RNA polymerase sigma-70 factor, ECF subfamily
MAIAAAPTGEAVNREFEGLFNEHFQFVYCTAYAVTANRQDAEDVLQTIFLRLIRRVTPPALTQNPKAYLYRAAVNESLNVIRARKRQELTDNLDGLEALASPVTEPDNELQRCVVDAMAKLHPSVIEILILRYEHNFSDAQIAKMLGKSRGTVAVTLYRARARLKKLLSAAMGDKL